MNQYLLAVKVKKSFLWISNRRLNITCNDRKVLAKSISCNRSVCSSIIIINDGATRCVVHTFQLKNIFYPSKYFLGLTLPWKKLVKYHCLLRLSSVDKRFLCCLYFMVFNGYWIMNTRSNLWFVPKN